jgi:hypothetical protein
MQPAKQLKTRCSLTDLVSADLRQLRARRVRDREGGGEWRSDIEVDISSGVSRYLPHGTRKDNGRALQKFCTSVKLPSLNPSYLA